jgi:hypothetical protein
MTKERSLVESVERLIGAAADFGAAVARAADKTTAGGREPAEGPPGEGAVAAIVRHGVTAAVNLVSQITDANQGMRAAAAAAAATQTQGTATPGSAGHVRPGATLRVPLSIENPGREPMTDLTPAVLSWSCDGNDTEAVATVRFIPETLNIAPRDFEKLTVCVEVPDDACAGRYQLEIALAEGVRTALAFTVRPEPVREDSAKE